MYNHAASDGIYYASIYNKKIIMRWKRVLMASLLPSIQCYTQIGRYVLALWNKWPRILLCKLLFSVDSSGVQKMLNPRQCNAPLYKKG
jgi:hypothetical protein